MDSFEISIWNQTRGRLLSFVLRRTRDKALAEDIVHDVFLKVHDRLPQLRQTDKIVGWIFRIASNTIADHFRNTSKTVSSADLDGNDDGVTLNDCVAACLLEMLKTLPEKYRQALELAELSEMSQLQLAKTLNISYSAVKSRVQRARKMLKEKMDKAYRIQFDNYGNALVCGNKLPCGCS
jgi:RNA polymerase sigma-70 factor (ECF subfamily)